MQEENKGIIAGVTKAEMKIFKSHLMLDDSPVIFGQEDCVKNTRVAAVPESGSKFRRNSQRHRAGFLSRDQAGWATLSQKTGL